MPEFNSVSNTHRSHSVRSWYSSFPYISATSKEKGLAPLLHHILKPWCQVYLFCGKFTIVVDPFLLLSITLSTL